MLLFLNFNTQTELELELVTSLPVQKTGYLLSYTIRLSFQRKKLEDQRSKSNIVIVELPENPMSTEQTALVPVDNKGQIIADIKGGRVLKAEEESTEEHTTSEITKQSKTEQYAENSEEEQLNATAKIVQEHGSTDKSMDRNRKVTQSVSERLEGNKKVTEAKMESHQSFSMEESSEFEWEDA